MIKSVYNYPSSWVQMIAKGDAGLAEQDRQNPPSGSRGAGDVFSGYYIPMTVPVTI